MITPTTLIMLRCDNFKIIFQLKLMNLKTKATIAYPNSTAAYCLHCSMPQQTKVKLGYNFGTPCH